MSAHLDRGRILLSQSRFEQAETEFRRSLADDPDDPLTHVLLAESLIGQDKAVDATAEAQKAIGLAPEFDAAHATLARSLAQRNRYEEALEAINQAVALQPSDADNRTIKAAVLVNAHRSKEALEEVSAALEINPEHPVALTLKPRILQSLGRLDEAELATRETMRQRADDADSHVSRGWVLLEQGNAKEARGHFRDALRLDPNNDVARAGLVESIKATNFLYRWFLAYAFRMSRLSPGASMGIIVGLFVFIRVLNAVGRENPSVAPYILPLIGLYLLFAVFTWIAAPLSNLLLRLHPDGRLALNVEQKRGSDILLVCFGAIGLSLAMLTVTLNEIWAYRAFWFLLLMLPASAIMHAPRGWPRQTMFAMCGVLTCLILSGLVSMPLQERLTPILPFLLIASQFAANGLVMTRPRDQVE